MQRLSWHILSVQLLMSIPSTTVAQPQGNGAGLVFATSDFRAALEDPKVSLITLSGTHLSASPGLRSCARAAY